MTEHKLWHSCTALLTAVVLTGLGVVLFLHADLGSDTITVFIDGLRRSLSISLGSASRLYNIAALAAALCLSRKSIGWTSIVYALSTGIFMDLFDELLTPFALMHTSLAMRCVLMVIGQLCIILSFALLICYGSGMDQLDAIAVGVEKRTGVAYRYIRTLLDAILIISGFFMGGVVGIGSIFAMLTTGIGVDLLVKRLSN